MTEMESLRNKHPCTGLSKESRQGDNVGQRQGISDKNKLSKRSEKKETWEAYKRHKHQQSQGRCDVGPSESGIGANGRLDERSGPQHGRNPNHRANENSNRHDDAHFLDWKGWHGPQPETSDGKDPLRSQRLHGTDSYVDAERDRISRREEKDRYRVREVDLTIPRDPNPLREADLTVSSIRDTETERKPHLSTTDGKEGVDSSRRLGNEST